MAYRSASKRPHPLTSTDPDANAGVSGHTGCVVGSASYTACTAYDATYDAVPTTKTNALNQTTSTAYASDVSGGFGLWPTSVTDPNGQTTGYGYDQLGRMTSQTLPGETSGDTTTSWSYTVWCATTGAQTPCLEIDQTQRLDSATTITSRAFYDGWGRLIETRAPAPGGQDVVTYAQYDQAGRKTFQSVPYFVSAYTGAPGASAFATPDTSQLGTTWTYAAVPGGSLLTSSVKDALGHQTTTTAGVACAPVSGDSGCYTTTTTTDALGHQAITYRDGLGRLTYTRTYTGTSAPYTLYATTTQGYDGAGRLVSVIRPDGATLSFTYDDAGRQTASHDPDRGAETAAYDANGNVTQTTNARGSSGTIYAGYDGLNRQLWRNTTNTATGAYVTYGYDSTASAGGVGRLTSETFSNANAGGSLTGSYAYGYDGRGQVTATTETVGGTPYATSATYNDAGQLLGQVYPNGDTLTTSYDPLSGWQDQLSLTPSGGSTVHLLTAEAYNGAAGALGLMTSATLGAFSGGGVGSYAASYDLLGRLTSESATYTPSGGSASTLYQVQPTYDALGNIIESVTTLPQGVDTQVFCYDDLSRLTWAGSSGTPTCAGAPTPGDTGSLSGTGGASYSASYTYDLLNRLTSGPLGGYSYGDAAHADAATSIGGSAWSASYDAAGNLTCRAATSATTCSGASPSGAALSYDNEGQLATWANAQSSPTSSASYLYDGEGQRVEQVATTTGTTTTTSYIGSLEEVATTGATATTTVYYGGLATSVNGALSYTLADGLGSVSESVNAATGAVTATQLYAPYGAVRYQSGTLPGSRGYTGQHQRPRLLRGALL